MSQALDPVTQHHIDRQPTRCAREFEGVFSKETIERYMAESTDLLGGARSTSSFPCSCIASRASGCERSRRRRD